MAEVVLNDLHRHRVALSWSAVKRVRSVRVPEPMRAGLPELLGVDD